MYIIQLLNSAPYLTSPPRHANHLDIVPKDPLNAIIVTPSCDLKDPR